MEVSVTLPTKMALKIAFLIALLFHNFSAYTVSSSRNGFSLKLIPRFKIDKALFPENLTLFEMHERIVQLSKARASYFKSTSNPEALRPYVLRIYTSLYIVEVALGTNQYKANLLLDSGSDDTWLQCDGCVNCFPLSGGNFNYHQSKTYKAVSCNHPLCNPRICSGDFCLYNNRYIGGSLTIGILSAESFSFPDRQGSTGQSFSNVVFGCGLDNRNIMFGGPMTDLNVIAGIFGLGAGQRSLLSQLASVTNLRFSYCFVSWTVPDPPYSYMRFGDDAQLSGDIKTMQLISRTLPRYYVSLTGISFDEKRLPIDPSLFALKPDRSGGFAFDTGSGPSFLVKSAYSVARDWIKAYFEPFEMHPVTDRVPYDLCYMKEQKIQGYTRPSMTYHFEGGADLVLDSDAVFQNFDETGMFCFAVVPLDDDAGPSLLGAFQQVNYRFLFDVKASTVSFVSHQNCFNS